MSRIFLCVFFSLLILLLSARGRNLNFCALLYIFSHYCTCALAFACVIFIDVFVYCWNALNIKILYVCCDSHIDHHCRNVPDFFTSHLISLVYLFTHAMRCDARCCVLMRQCPSPHDYLRLQINSQSFIHFNQILRRKNNDFGANKIDTERQPN